MTQKNALEAILTTHPNTPNRTLAKMLCKKHPTLFTNEEGARDMVRYRRGAKGKRDLLLATHPRPKGSQADRPTEKDAEEARPSEMLPDAILRVMAKNLRKNKGVSVNDLSNQLDRGPDSIKSALDELRKLGYNMAVNPDEEVELAMTIPKQATLPIDTRDYFGDDWIRFGFVTDTHLCSRYERLDVLNSLYDIYEREGIKTVYHAGNWIDGEARFNKYDIHCIGVESQIAYFLKNYPQRKDMVTQIISGDDHEGWYVQNCQIDVGKTMEDRAKAAGRYDLIDLGYMERDLAFKQDDGEAIVRVVHAGGGSAYAHSYTSQKMVESLQGGEKPKMILIGHFHKYDWDYPREVHTIQGGCFTGNTRITTDSGQKQIRDIQVGDMVLTHRNRFRKVVALTPPRKASDLYVMNYGRKGRFDQRITATSEHPILVEKDGVPSWVKIKDIKPGDWVYVEPVQPRSDYESDESGFVKVRVLSCGPVPPRKKRGVETVYNFQVDEDDSYVAGHVVVHNCTMDQSPFMRKKRIQAMVGGCLVEIKQDRKGCFVRVRVEWIPFYDKKFYSYKWS